MRILQLLSQIQPTGAEAYAITLANWLTDHGHEVFIVSDRIHVKTRQPYIPLAVHEKRVKARIMSTLFLRNFLREHRIQIIHCHSRAAARLAYWATRGTKVAVVSTLHGRQPVSLSKRMFNIYGDKVISICENLSRHVLATLAMDERKMRLVRNPVDSQKLPLVESLVETPPSELKIAWVGRFTGPKGERAREFIEKSVPTLLQQFPKLEIEVIGGNPQLLGSETLERISALQEKYSKRLQVHTHLDHLDQMLEKFHIVLGAGRVAISSLMRGVPTYAIGEYCAEGFVTLENLGRAMASNFGDIGYDGQATAPIDFAQITRELRAFLETPPIWHLAERRRIREVIFKNYDQEKVCKKIFNTYKSAYFLKNYSKHIPILMYHKVPAQNLESQHRIFVTKDTFASHLKFFKDKGFTTLTFKDLEEYRSGTKDFASFPRKPLILTFDDGYVDNLTNAAPLLKEFAMRAVIFLLADHQLQTNSWDNDGQEPLQPLMNLEQKKELLHFDYEIGSHGFKHRKIIEMSEEEALYELGESKRELEKHFGPISTYAFTYGVTTPWAAELAEEVGYDFAVNTDSGGLHHEDNPYSIFRVNIFPEDGPAQLRKKTSSWYRKYFYLKHGR
ncbi:MAG: glycosyltransferase [Pseudobdellovibrionaceae bacterium]